jgi:hypothetical protein
MRLRNAIAALDRAAMRRFAQNDSRLLDLVMPRLSRAANHGMLWTGLAIGLWVTGDRWARREAEPAARRHRGAGQAGDVICGAGSHCGRIGKDFKVVIHRARPSRRTGSAPPG